MKWLWITLFTIMHVLANAQLTPFEKNGKNYTATYDECIAYYKQLQSQYKGILIKTIGETDANVPLQIVLINAENNFNIQQWKQQEKCIILINNGIHAGEPDGIDACMMFARDLMQQIKAETFSKNVCIAIIPIYNIGGVLLRGKDNRVDQNGPEEFGQRGNSQNLDLNRDFIKCDAKESKSFAHIFHQLSPHIFLDNHVSDGADYPYTMTLITSQKDKVGGQLGAYLSNKIAPAIYAKMEQKKCKMIPYVNVWGHDAKQGWTEFFDSPRYSTGFTSLFNTLSFVPETHMLKPYPQRVDATYQLMHSFVEYAADHAPEIVAIKTKSEQDMLTQKQFAIAWSIDRSKHDILKFDGYAYQQKTSGVSGLSVPFYNRSAPYSDTVPFYNSYKATTIVDAPIAYLIPQGWQRVIDLLKTNGVQMKQFLRDTSVTVEVYQIDAYKANPIPFELHHFNSSISITKNKKTIAFRKGDYYIGTNQLAKRFLIETLEPHAMDSYFSWNFFDGILIQKEGYTDYAFEDIAAAFLKEHPTVRDSLQLAIAADTSMANSADAQLEFVYKHSPYPEPRLNQYPVYRLTNNDEAEQQIKQQLNLKNKKDE
jgi:Zinc carboxypeptidase